MSIPEKMVRFFGHRASYLDKDNILWKVVDNKWIGKRSIWSSDNRACWLEELGQNRVKSWWCGEGADYAETFKL